MFPPLVFFPRIQVPKPWMADLDDGRALRQDGVPVEMFDLPHVTNTVGH